MARKARQQPSPSSTDNRQPTANLPALPSLPAENTTAYPPAEVETPATRQQVRGAYGTSNTSDLPEAAEMRGRIDFRA